MKLFFETAGQANRFLTMIPLGFTLALCLDADVLTGRLSLLLDCLLPLIAGVAALATIAVLRESGLRAYHLLGLLTGAVIYTQGVGRIIRTAKRWLRNHGRVQEKTPGM